jgi:VWFA-related protein
VRAACLAAVLGILLQQPAFRSRVDLIRLDVGVLDSDGRPVRDLRADDFVVRIDGVPRRVSLAQFYGPDDGPRPAASDAPVSVATNGTAQPGRVIVLVADLESITPGAEKPILETAAALLDRLSAADAVGLLTLPGRSVELTRDHAKVRDALLGLRGAGTPPAFGYTMTVREAEAFRLGDQRITAEVIERECRPSDGTCAIELRNLAMPLLIEADRRTQGLVAALSSLLTRLERIDVPRTVVLLSAGVQRRPGSAAWFNDLQRAADAAGVSLAIVQIEQPGADASRRGPGGAVTRADLADGLSAIAGATGATLYHGVGRAAGAFDRIRSEIVHSYQLALESLPSDADGRRHRLEVEVKRDGVTVRARRELARTGTPPRTMNPVDLLAQPVALTEAPLTVATYMTRGDDASTLKVIVLVESNAASAEGPAAYAFSVADGERPVFETADRMAAGSPAVSVAAQLPPGRYRLRAAVVDAAGRHGSLDMPIVVGLRQAGELQFSDLIVGRLEGTFAPATRVPPGAPLVALLELYSADAARLDGLTVSLDVRRAGQPSAARFPAEVRQTALDRRRLATATIPADALAPGTWLISAVVRRGDALVGQVSRGVVVEPAGGPHAK